MKQVIVFLGLPGAGKGTQAKLYSEKKGIAHISTGEMLRSAVQSGTELGQKVKETIESGQLVGNQMMVALIQDRVNSKDCKNGYILDGFPRTIPQAKALDTMLGGVSAAVYFEIPEEEVLNRMSERADKEGRADDSVETRHERIKVYKNQTEPLVNYYKKLSKLIVVDAKPSVEEVAENLEKEVSHL